MRAALNGVLERKIPRSMSTQHPDNATVPHWSKEEAIQGDDEVHEAYLAFSLYGVHEVMWDSEGKDVDTHVLRKLLSRYPEFFLKNEIGKDVFLTYRIPNPKIEGAERKVVVETLETIPINCDVAEKFYGNSKPPIFEVILPFTTSSTDLIAVLRYYEKAVAGKETIVLDDEMKVRDWVGEVRPKTIEVIPLVEDRESLLGIRSILEGYIRAVHPRYVRAFIARSDPAMNYGMVTAVVLAKYALSELRLLQDQSKVPIFPIIGVGSLPFRGHMSPDNVDNIISEYRWIYTYTIQSAYKYDYDENLVRSSISRLNSSRVDEPLIFDRETKESLVKIVDKLVSKYQPVIEGISERINEVASMLPPRRARKLHVGLFGYSRSTGKVRLPRAISFVGALYSMGVPPEIIGIRAIGEMRESEQQLLETVYVNLKRDLEKAAYFFCWNAFESLRNRVDRWVWNAIGEDVKFLSENLGIKVGGRDYSSIKHCLFSSLFVIAMENGRNEEARLYLSEMAKARRALG